MPIPPSESVWTYIISASAIGSIITGIVITRINKWLDKSESSASKEYVDKEISKVVTKVEKIEEQMDSKASSEDLKEMKVTLITMDARIYDIWKLTSTNHDPNRKQVNV